MRLHGVARHVGPGTVRFSARLDDTEAWIEVRAPPALQAALTPSLMPFIPVAIITAAERRRDLHIEGAVDDLWWLQLREGLAPFAAALYGGRSPELTRVPELANTPPLQRADLALLFSAGVDSFHSLHRMQRAGTPPAWFINVNAGAQGPYREGWRRGLGVISACAREVGAEVIALDSNFHELFPSPHVEAHSLRNLAVLLALYPTLGRFVYSAGSVFSDIVWPTSRPFELARLDHEVTAMLLPANVKVTHVGWAANRIAKTAEIAGLPITQRWLEVCLNQKYRAHRREDEPPNCGRCRKCVRTMVTLERQGALDAFAGRFDLAAFRAARRELLGKLAASNDRLDQEALRYIAN